MTRPRQHNAIEVFTLPLGFTKSSRLSSFIQGELQPKCLLAHTRDFRSAIMDPVGFKKGHPTWELYVSAKWSLDTSSKCLQSWNLVSKPHCALSVLQLNQLKVCCLNFSAKVSRQEAAERERERHKLTFEKSTVQRCYVEMAGKPEHHFFGQQNFFFPRRGSNCSPSVSAGGN